MAAKFLAAMAMTVFTFAAGASQAQSQADDLSDVTLRVGFFGEVKRTQFAQSQFFKDTPYKIEWAVFNGGAAGIQALVGEAVDFLWSPPFVGLYIASASDFDVWTRETAPLKVVGFIEPMDPVRYPGTVFVAHKDAGVDSLKDLKGKSFAFSKGGNAEARLLFALDGVGLSKSDIKLISLPTDSQAPAVIAGTVDVASVITSDVASSIEDGSLKRLASAHDVGWPGYTALTVRTTLLKDEKLVAATQDFLTRAARHSNYLAEHPEAGAKEYERIESLTPEQALDAARNATVISGTDPAREQYVKEKAALDKYVRLGLIEKPIDFDALFDHRFDAAIEAGNRK